MREFHNHGDSGWIIVLNRVKWPIRMTILLTLNFSNWMAGYGRYGRIVRKWNIVAFKRVWWFLNTNSMQLKDSRELMVGCSILPRIYIGWGRQVVVRISWLWFDHQLRCSPNLMKSRRVLNWKGFYISLNGIELIPTLEVELMKSRKYQSNFEIQFSWLFLGFDYRKDWWSKAAHPARIKKASQFDETL